MQVPLPPESLGGLSASASAWVQRRTPPMVLDKGLAACPLTNAQRGERERKKKSSTMRTFNAEAGEASEAKPL